MSHSPAQTPRQYAPLYFLASVGSGGLVVTFFMYLMFWVKHPGQPVPVFEDILRALNGGSPWQTAAIIAALPTLLVYVVAGKYFISGLTAGSVKG